MLKKKYMIIGFLALCLTATLFIGTTTSPATTSLQPYDPWYDVNDDGIIDIFDIVNLGIRYGTTGNPVTKSALLFDSGWLNITDKAGQYFNITHNLNGTDIIVDITGKTTLDGGAHQRHLGGTGYVLERGRPYGGTSDDHAYSVVETSDGGYALAGKTESFGAGGEDFWLIKVDSSGNHQWNKTYGGTNFDMGYSVVETSDGGYAIGGSTMSFGTGNYDFWLVKTDANGNPLWNQTYGGEGEDRAFPMVHTGDGGYALAGYTYSFGAGNADFWLVKTDRVGNIQWVNDWFKYGLAWTDSTANTITLYRGATDLYWNYVRVRIWKIKETP